MGKEGERGIIDILLSGRSDTLNKEKKSAEESHSERVSAAVPH